MRNPDSSKLALFVVGLVAVVGLYQLWAAGSTASYVDITGFVGFGRLCSSDAECDANLVCMRDRLGGSQNCLSKRDISGFCERGVECQSGVCTANVCSNQQQAPSCSDSDGGRDIFRQGNVQYNGVSQSDACSTDTVLTEYYCDGNGRRQQTPVYCNDEGDRSSRCRNGACTSQQAQQQPAQQQQQAGCSETDRGNDPTWTGTTTYQSTSSTDRCSTDTVLTEYYCDANGRRQQQNVYCNDQYGASSRCLNGACTTPPQQQPAQQQQAQPSCSETDQGDQPAQAGTTTYQGVQSRDECRSDTMLTEYYCDNNGRRQQRAVDCHALSRTRCSNGACGGGQQAQQAPQQQAQQRQVARGRSNGEGCSSNADCESGMCEWSNLLYRMSRPDTSSCRTRSDCGSSSAECRTMQGYGMTCQQKYCVAQRPQPNRARCARDQDCTSGWCQQHGGPNYVCREGNTCNREYDSCQNGRICRWELTGNQNTPPAQRNFNRYGPLGCFWPVHEGHPCERDRDCRDGMACVANRCRQTEVQQQAQQQQAAQQQVQAASCTDSENRINLDQQGTVTYQGVSLTDTCMTETVLKEYFCTTQGRRGERSIDCYGVVGRSRCSNGVCVR